MNYLAIIIFVAIYLATQSMLVADAARGNDKCGSCDKNHKSNRNPAGYIPGFHRVMQGGKYVYKKIGQ